MQIAVHEKDAKIRFWTSSHKILNCISIEQLITVTNLFLHRKILLQPDKCKNSQLVMNRTCEHRGNIWFPSKTFPLHMYLLHQISSELSLHPSRRLHMPFEQIHRQDLQLQPCLNISFLNFLKGSLSSPAKCMQVKARKDQTIILRTE